MNFINVKNNKNIFADGIHDDTKAIQACIDAVKDGGTVYFPDGTYLVSAALIFYSNQHFMFTDKAAVLRSDKSEPLTRYLLASYSEPAWGGYDGTHDVIISGGIFDGNANLTEHSTLVNTVHCNNITIENCRFVHCSQWHFIEINSSENVTVKNCFFDGTTYTVINDGLRNEMLQLDCASVNSYGPVYNCDGRHIEHCIDDTACRNIVIKSNIFKCNGFPAIGHHADCEHYNIEVSNNIFDGPSGMNSMSRGYIIFRPQVHGIKILDNAFFAPEESDSANIGVIIENPSKDALTADGNLFKGDILKEFTTE